MVWHPKPAARACQAALGAWFGAASWPEACCRVPSASTSSGRVSRPAAREGSRLSGSVEDPGCARLCEGHQPGRQVADVEHRLLAREVGPSLPHGLHHVRVQGRQLLGFLVLVELPVTGVGIGAGNEQEPIGDRFERLDRAAYVAGLASEVEHRVPPLTGDAVVSVRTMAVGNHHPSAVDEMPGLTSGQARHCMTTGHSFTDQRTAQPRRTAQHQKIHDHSRTMTQGQVLTAVSRRYSQFMVVPVAGQKRRATDSMAASNSASAARSVPTAR